MRIGRIRGPRLDLPEHVALLAHAEEVLRIDLVGRDVEQRYYLGVTRYRRDPEDNELLHQWSMHSGSSSRLKSCLKCAVHRRHQKIDLGIFDHQGRGDTQHIFVRVFRDDAALHQQFG